MPIVIKDINAEPYVSREPGPDGKYFVPGVGKFRVDQNQAQTKFLGSDPEAGPWVYLIDRPAGDGTSWHKHTANRIEFIVDGEIQWHDSEGNEATFGAGTINYVPAGTQYEYVTTKPTRILLWFDQRPSWIGEASR